MSTELRIDEFDEDLKRLTARVRGLKKLQDEMLDLLGITVEGQQRIATRTERLEQYALEREERDKQREENDRKREEKLRQTVDEISDKLNALISVVDGFIRGKQ